MDFLHRSKQEVVHIEEMAKQQIADTELKANKILDEQRQAMKEHANYEFHLRDAKSVGTVINIRRLSFATKMLNSFAKVRTMKSQDKSSTSLEQNCRVVKEHI